MNQVACAFLTVIILSSQTAASVVSNHPDWDGAQGLTGWWEDAVLVWTADGAGKYPDTFGRTTVEGELVSAADIQAAAGVGAGLTPSMLVGYGWWQVKVMRWTAGGAGPYPGGHPSGVAPSTGPCTAAGADSTGAPPPPPPFET